MTMYYYFSSVLFMQWKKVIITSLCFNGKKKAAYILDPVRTLGLQEEWIKATCI